MGLFDKIKNTSVHLQSCPKCGKDQLKGGVLKSEVVCRNCEYETTFSQIRKYSTTGGHEYDEEYVGNLVQTADGGTVTESVLKATGAGQSTVLDFLDEDEQPHHIIKGNTIDVEGGGDSTSLLGNNRSRKMSVGINQCLTVITDERVFVIIQQGNGTDERHIPYDSITGIDLDIGGGGATSRLSLQTHGRTYHLSGSLSDEADCRKAIEYVRHRRDELTQGQEDSGNTQASPLDQLERLKSLKDEGDISEAEFKKKKDELLDRI
ncbi:PH domain-containing protein [Halobacterium noricense]|uniref:PH domain-containing protein n=1 Tax=Halobacterium noricense TaxID=223182 RepID=UPI001E4CE75D|nr:PH domain-containing protein [Halobacterium noricense]UHH26437.1 PH domain-containing protein [Halobacterium noricense]